MDQMKLGMEVGLSPGHIVLDGDPASVSPMGRSPQFSAQVCCGQMPGWMKMPLVMEVGLGPGNIVLDGDPFPPKRGAALEHPSLFVSAHVCCGETVAHLSYC